MNEFDIKVYRKQEGFKKLKQVIQNIKESPTIRVVHNMMLSCELYDAHHRYDNPNHTGILYRWIKKNNLLPLLEANYE